MFAAATSFFSRTNISQNYNYGGPLQASSRSSTPGPAASSSAPAAHTPPVQISLWKVQSATHKTTNKRVSVWTFDKRRPEVDKLQPAAKDRVLEVLKAEASALSRLRHPCILEMVEPLEETRSELVFATEPVLSSLQLSIPGASRGSSIVELDEVEIQKGVLQLCKGLSFLHSSANLIHSNITPDNIIINSAGDWKISGLGLTIPLLGPDGKPMRWEFPTFDGRVPPYIQRSFDYMAPEYALDEQLVTASDMYSLGCLLYAVHCKGNPPFKTHGSIGGLRDNAGRPVPDIDRLDGDLQSLLRSLITRHPSSRPTPTSIQTHPFFSSLPISTLNFLDRSNFATKSREEKISFMKGLTGVLTKFSEGLRIRKILPSLLEEMKDTNLLPYILPNVFSIAEALGPHQFGVTVLPSLKPLFAIKEPPQNMLTLLENLQMLQNKTEKTVFRQEVLPLLYNALESEHAVVQERALKCVPDLCETIDYAEVKGVLFPRVAVVFTKTRILSVKIATLVTFLSMIKTLDQSSLTQNLVPLLSKIRTKEPGVMMATLSVHEAMGFKVDREAVATLVLPQLWAMSMGPLLSVSQFQRFMSVIERLGERVKKEHDQFLRDSQRLEDRSSIPVDSITNGVPTARAVDFESLVGRTNGTAIKPDSAVENVSWDDDVWGSILAADTPETPRVQSPAIQASSSTASSYTQSLPSTPNIANKDTLPAGSPRPSRLGTRSTTSSSLNANPYPSLSTTQPKPSPSVATRTSSTISSASSTSMTPSAAPAPNYNISLTPSTMQPSIPFQSPPPPSQPPLPNYNISLSPAMAPTTMSPMMSSPPLMAVAASPPPPPAMMNVLAPSKPAQPSWNSKPAGNSSDWADFDPLA